MCANKLRSASGNLNHLNVKLPPCKSSLSCQNKHRNWKLFQDYYFELLGKLSDTTSPHVQNSTFTSTFLPFRSTTTEADSPALYPEKSAHVAHHVSNRAITHLITTSPFNKPALMAGLSSLTSAMSIPVPSYKRASPRALQ